MIHKGQGMAAGCSLSALQMLTGAQEAEGLLRSGVPGEQCRVVWGPGGSLIPHGPLRLPHPSHREWKVALEPKSQLSVHKVKIKHLLTPPQTQAPSPPPVLLCPFPSNVPPSPTRPDIPVSFLTL